MLIVLMLVVILLVIAPLAILLLGRWAYSNSARRDLRIHPAPAVPVSPAPQPELPLPESVPGWVRAGPAQGKGYFWK